jgi:hypothetical protein
MQIPCFLYLYLKHDFEFRVYVICWDASYVLPYTKIGIFRASNQTAGCSLMYRSCRKDGLEVCVDTHNYAPSLTTNVTHIATDISNA